MDEEPKVPTIAVINDAKVYSEKGAIMGYMSWNTSLRMMVLIGIRRRKKWTHIWKRKRCKTQDSWKSCSGFLMANFVSIVRYVS